MRPFNGFSSNSDTYVAWDSGSDFGFTADRAGNQTAALGKEGINICGGSDGFNGTPQSGFKRYNPLDHTAVDLAGTGLARKFSAVVSYDDAIFMLGGSDSSNPEEEVFKFNIPDSAKSYEGGPNPFHDLQDNANSSLDIAHHGGCLTPYGIALVGGADNSMAARTGVWVFYPHARMNTGTPADYGETLAMPSLTTAANYTSAVCHFSRADKKWYLYRIGGVNATTVDGTTLATVEKFDFVANTWSYIAPNPNALVAKRSSAAVCSWGDEIFIFGGNNVSNLLDSGVAWNPDTNNYRQLSDIADAETAISAFTDADDRTTHMAAVPCGPYIYLIDGANVPGSGGGIRRIRRYTP